MKLLPRFLVAGALLAAVQSFAADSFSGHITLTMTGAKDKPMTMIYGILGQSMRIDTETGKGEQNTMIMDLGKHEMYIIMHAQKMYMVRSMAAPPANPDEARPGAAAPARSADPDHVPEIEATGKSEVICGYKCNQFIMKDDQRETEMWLAEGLAPFMGMGGGPGAGGGGGMFGGRHASNSAAGAKWELALKGKGGFPLRVITHEKGKETFKMEATKVEKGGISESDMVPPADYKQFQMPSLGDMFKRG